MRGFAQPLTAGKGSIGCAVPNGTGGFITQVLDTIGLPKNIQISKNTMESDLTGFPVVLLEVENPTIKENHITSGATGLGMITLRVDHGIVENNTIDLNHAGFFGIAVDPSNNYSF